MSLGASDRVVIPVVLKSFAVIVDHFKKDKMQEPDMLRIGPIQSMQPL